MTRTLIVAPSAREAAAIGADAAVCGAGAGAGGDVAARLRDGAFDLVVIAGVCGGLDPSLAPGSLIIARRCVAPDGEERAVDAAVLDAMRAALRARRIPFVSSSLLTVATPVASRREKTELWNRHGAAGVDMETFGVVAAAEAAGVPWLAIRAVVDAARDALPPSLRDWTGDVPDREIARTALRHPAEWLAYARLALNMRAALRALRASAPALRTAARALDGRAALAPAAAAIPIEVVGVRAGSGTTGGGSG